MTDKIKEHINSLFIDAPKTRGVEDMRQELLAGCLDKYNDLISGGMAPDEAYLEVVDGIGDVGELLGHIEKINTFDPGSVLENRKKRAFFLSIGICAFFAAIAFMIVFASMGFPELGGALMIMCIGIGTVLIIYGVMTTVTKYVKRDDTMVENLKVQMTVGKKQTRMMKLASSTLWCAVVTVYLVVSFIFFNWHVSWVIFLLGAAAQGIMSARFNPYNAEKGITGAYWCLVVTVYICISFATMAWHITWIVFPLAVALQQAVRFYLAWREEE